MICTGHQGITALDFYLSLTDRECQHACRGPLVYLRLNTVTAEKMLEGSAAVGMADEFSNTFISETRDGSGAFGACMAHWVDLSTSIAAVGDGMGRKDLSYVGEELFKTACRIAGWDFKEVYNYLQSYGTGVEEE